MFSVPDVHCCHPLVILGITQVIFVQILRYHSKPSSPLFQSIYNMSNMKGKPVFHLYFKVVTVGYKQEIALKHIGFTP